MALIKDVYSKTFYEEFGKVASKHVPNFSTIKFIKKIFASDFETMEWKQRLNLSTAVLHEFMPADFTQSADILCRMVDDLRSDGHYTSSFPYLFFQDYITKYGTGHFEVSMKSIGHITKFISGEFAVRPFILKHEKNALIIMEKWSLSENHHVRRLASEGSRPRLPWGVALQFLKKDPQPILPILENLRNDPSEYVRRSVANSLNDIGKDHPDLLIKIAHKWKGISKETDGIIKHACRNLLKQGHPEILNYYGLVGENTEISNLQIHIPKISVGDYVSFDFNLKNKLEDAQHIRLEYAVYYLRANGSHTKKVFKISEKSYAGAKITLISKKQSFKIITTRVFYPGIHYISVIANGTEGEKHAFELI